MTLKGWPGFSGSREDYAFGYYYSTIRGIYLTLRQTHETHPWALAKPLPILHSAAVILIAMRVTVFHAALLFFLFGTVQRIFCDRMNSSLRCPDQRGFDSSEGLLVAATPLVSARVTVTVAPFVPAVTTVRPVAFVPATAVGPVALGCAARLTGVVDSELAAVDALLLQNLLGLNGALDVDEVGVCETPGLTGTTVDGDSDVKDVLDSPE